MLEQHPSLQSVVLCLDHDEPGQTAARDVYKRQAETRAYLDARCRPDRDRRRRPAASKATQMQKEEATDGDH